MVAVEQLAASEGTQYWVNAVIHYVMCTDWRQRVALQKNPASSTDDVKETPITVFSLLAGWQKGHTL